MFICNMSFFGGSNKHQRQHGRDKKSTSHRRTERELGGVTRKLEQQRIQRSKQKKLLKTDPTNASVYKRNLEKLSTTIKKLKKEERKLTMIVKRYDEVHEANFMHHTMNDVMRESQIASGTHHADPLQLHRQAMEFRQKRDKQKHVQDTLKETYHEFFDECSSSEESSNMESTSSSSEILNGCDVYPEIPVDHTPTLDEIQKRVNGLSVSATIDNHPQ